MIQLSDFIKNILIRVLKMNEWGWNNMRASKYWKNFHLSQSHLFFQSQVLTELKSDNQRLKDENGALIRVISKLSKWGRPVEEGGETLNRERTKSENFTLTSTWWFGSSLTLGAAAPRLKGEFTQQWKFCHHLLTFTLFPTCVTSYHLWNITVNI